MTDKTRCLIRTYRDCGLPWREIADLMGINRTTLMYRRKRLGLPVDYRDKRFGKQPGPDTRRQLMHRIEAEYDEPIREVIRVYRKQGNTWRTVAGALGINLHTLILWRKALGLPVDQNDKQYDPLSFPKRDRY